MTAYSAWEIVNMLNSRNPDYFSVVHGTYFRRMLVVCLKRRVPPAEAEDMVTDIFVYLYTKGKNKTFDSPLALSNYLFRSIYNKCNSWARTRNLHLKLFDEARLGSDSLMDLLELTARERIWAAVTGKIRDILDKSDYRALQIVRMVYLEEKSVREIASEMGIAEQTVRNLKGMGLKMMRKSIKKEDLSINIVLLFLLTYLILS